MRKTIGWIMLAIPLIAYLVLEAQFVGIQVILMAIGVILFLFGWTWISMKVMGKI